MSQDNTKMVEASISAIRRRREFLRQRVENRRLKPSDSKLPSRSTSSDVLRSNVQSSLRLLLVQILFEESMLLPVDARVLSWKVCRALNPKLSVVKSTFPKVVQDLYISWPDDKRTASIADLLVDIERTVKDSLKICRLKFDNRVVLTDINRKTLKTNFPDLMNRLSTAIVSSSQFVNDAKSQNSESPHSVFQFVPVQSAAAAITKKRSLQSVSRSPGKKPASKPPDPKSEGKSRNSSSERAHSRSSRSQPTESREKSSKMEEEPPRKKPRIDRKKEAAEEIASLLVPSFKDRALTHEGKAITDLLGFRTFREQRTAEQFKTEGGTKMQEFCEFGTKADCRRENQSRSCCSRIHFKRILKPHTVLSLGNCSYLDGCRHMKTCKFIHYKIDRSTDSEDGKIARDSSISGSVEKFEHTFEAQWINCDVRKFDLSVLVPKGKNCSGFSVVLADPPWDIHMELPYGTLTDQEMLGLPVQELSTSGVIFLWVTGRVMELGRDCIAKWGYTFSEELIWVKTNQLQQLIRTGRTGHWLNHSKEHCLIGIKGDCEFNRRLDCDVIVAEVRETSRKPDEIYDIAERLCPAGKKIEIFGRAHNCRPGWIVLGNQLPGCKILNPDLASRCQARYPEMSFEGKVDLEPGLDESASVIKAETPGGGIARTKTALSSLIVPPIDTNAVISGNSMLKTVGRSEVPNLLRRRGHKIAAVSNSGPSSENKRMVSKSLAHDAGCRTQLSPETVDVSLPSHIVATDVAGDVAAPEIADAPPVTVTAPMAGDPNNDVVELVDSTAIVPDLVGVSDDVAGKIRKLDSQNPNSILSMLEQDFKRPASSTTTASNRSNRNDFEVLSDSEDEAEYRYK
uniref:mRNA m(6)A methyltransferase n=2 Tax=Hirondellea gigas TaxID=1518452 RepID=A0A6A7FTL8_9CRUS